jgi:hypothetical protein
MFTLSDTGGRTFLDEIVQPAQIIRWCVDGLILLWGSRMRGALPNQVGRRRRLVEADMVVSKKDVPGWRGAVPTLGFRRRVG